MSRPRRDRLPHPAARRLVRAGSPFAHCRAYWGRGTCNCVSNGEQLHLPLDISASEEGLVRARMTLNSSIEQAAEEMREAARLRRCAFELMAHYGPRIRGGRVLLLRMAWDAADCHAAAHARLESRRAELNALTESAPCLG